MACEVVGWLLLDGYTPSTTLPAPLPPPSKAYITISRDASALDNDQANMRASRLGCIQDDIVLVWLWLWVWDYSQHIFVCDHFLYTCFVQHTPQQTLAMQPIASRQLLQL